MVFSSLLNSNYLSNSTFLQEFLQFNKMKFLNLKTAKIPKLLNTRFSFIKVDRSVRRIVCFRARIFPESPEDHRHNVNVPE